MVDVVGQYKGIKAEIDLAIQEVIDEGLYINGPAVGKFRKDLSSYLGGVKVITCANGTDALQVALMALELNPGDEVITSNFSFIATIEVISLLKLKPVLVDVDPHSFNIDTTKIKEVINSKTKAIIPVHLFGQASPMAEIMGIARDYNIQVIEDTAQAIGTEYHFPGGLSKKAGTIGDIGTTSFFPSKTLGCFGDGGALFTEDEHLANRMQMIVNHGSRIKYHNEILGVNSRLDSIQAAVLNVKLKYLDQFIEARQKVAEFYDSALDAHPDIIIPGISDSGSHTYHQYTLRVINGKRDKLKDDLARHGIPSMVYYPVPLSLQKVFQPYGYEKGDFPVTESLCNEVLSLPMHTELSDIQLEYIVKKLLKSI